MLDLDEDIVALVGESPVDGVKVRQLAGKLSDKFGISNAYAVKSVQLCIRAHKIRSEYIETPHGDAWVVYPMDYNPKKTSKKESKK